MRTTFDRYLIVRYLQVFVILYVSMFGLFVVIDGFSNLDEFQDHAKSAVDLILLMSSYYANQSTQFLDMCGPILTVVDAMVVFALLVRNSELHPILAAGVPAWRLLVPITLSTALVNGLMCVNQELLIPRLAGVLSPGRDALFKGAIEIEPLTDPSSGIYINGQELSLNPQLIKNAEFVLPAPEIALAPTSIRAGQALYMHGTANHAAGWLLKNVDKPFARLALTAEGGQHVKALEGEPKDIFIVSDLPFDQLFNRLQSSKLLSTAELVYRLRSPAFGQATARIAQTLHARLVRPLANLLAMLVSIPLILRKESRGLIANMAIACGVLAALLGISEGSAFCGQSGMLMPELSAWLPVIAAGMLFAWLTPHMQT
ncbi:MAG TPA: LptF/LptG family permease [Planctomycetaceae bacterium]|nr:LptF/LptG family permease [Planctomycetaceae bacterium]